MDEALDIFRITRDYLERRLSLDAVQEWLVPRLGIYLGDIGSTGADLAGVLELGFADVAAGEASEDELRNSLDAFIRENAVVRVHVGITLASTATNTFVPAPSIYGPRVNSFERSSAGRSP